MENNKDIYKRILKSTTIVGGAQILNILVGVLKTKVIAFLLGPEGIGIAGILQTIIDIIRNASGFGINFSSVKSVAEAVNSGSTEKISYVAFVLKSWAIGTGILGAILIILFCIPLSQYSFGNNSYALGIALLSLVLLITSISSAQIALLQGLLRIKQMAQATFLGTAIGTCVTLPFYWWLGNNGIIPGMILTSLGSLLISWLYTKNIKIEKTSLKLKEVFYSGLGMAKLGFFIVVNGFIATVSLYAIRVFIVNYDGLVAVGVFQAVWTISTLYIGILLNSMLADFFPRLSIVHEDVEASNKLLNKQIEVLLLIATPMLVTMMIFTPIIVQILYSSSFSSAIPVLRWHMLAAFVTLISWALGVLFLAKNKGQYSIIGETLKQVSFVGIVFVGWQYFGFDILGIGFFLAVCLNAIYVLYCVLKFWSFRFTRVNMKYIIFFGLILILSFLNTLSSNIYIYYVFSSLIWIPLLVFCLWRLDHIMGIREWFYKRFEIERDTQ